MSARAAARSGEAKAACIASAESNSRTRERVERLAPHQRRINDVLFDCLDAKRFVALRGLASELVACGDRAVAMLELLMHEAEAA